jgi:TPP-dependent pyruvate/acetoin dehydrogenase alpha subunit
MEGRDGNIHLGAFARGTIPMISHLPEMLPVGMGVALARQQRGLKSAAVAFCGDGASCGGVFHETLNLAAVWNAPLVVVVERNRYANLTHESSYLPVGTLSERANGYGIRAATTDGNDVADVFEVVRQALGHARDGGGPVLVEAFTYRAHGHGAHDAQKYVPKEELDEWASRDPLLLWRVLADEHAGWSTAEQVELEERVAVEVERALQDALQAPFPSADDLEQSVFAA